MGKHKEADPADDSSNNGTTEIVRRQQPLPRTPGNPKLEELKHDFCLLAEKIQGSSHNPVLESPTEDNSKSCGGHENHDRHLRTPIACFSRDNSRGSRPPSRTYAAEPPVVASLERTKQTPKRNITVSKIAMIGGSSAARGKNEREASSTSHYHQDDVNAENLERTRVAAYTEGRSAAEAAARFANQALKGLNEELQAERRCRAAAERYAWNNFDTSLLPPPFATSVWCAPPRCYGIG